MTESEVFTQPPNSPDTNLMASVGSKPHTPQPTWPNGSIADFLGPNSLFNGSEFFWWQKKDLLNVRRVVIMRWLTGVHTELQKSPVTSWSVIPAEGKWSEDFQLSDNLQTSCRRWLSDGCRATDEVMATVPLMQPVPVRAHGFSFAAGSGAPGQKPGFAEAGSLWKTSRITDSKFRKKRKASKTV